MRHIDKDIWIGHIKHLTGWADFDISLPVIGFPDCRQLPVGWLVSFSTTGTKGFQFDVHTVTNSGRLYIVPSNAPGVCFSERLFCLSDHAVNNPCNAYFWHSGDKQWRFVLADAVQIQSVSFVDTDTLLVVYLSYANQIESCLITEHGAWFVESVNGDYIWELWQENGELAGIDQFGRTVKCERLGSNDRFSIEPRKSGFLLNTNPLAALPPDLQ